MGAVRRHWLHALLLVVVVFITTGAVTKGLLLFLDFLPLLPVDGISAADMLIGAVLDHASQTTEQSEDSGGGLLVNVILYLFQQRGSIFVAMTGRGFQPLHTYFQILRHALSEAVELVFPLIGTMAGTM